MSVRVQFTALGARRYRDFGRLVERALDAYTRNFANSIIKDLRRYPAPPPASTYQRTGILGASWHVSRAAGLGGIRYTISNYARDPRSSSYAQYVQGRRQQWYHARTGWLTIDNAIARHGGRDSFRRGAQAIISAAVSRV